jgi:hypothetical protein
MQAVGLGVERNPFCRAQLRQPCGKLLVGFNHAGIFTTKARRQKVLEFVLCPGGQVV